MTYIRIDFLLHLLQHNSRIPEDLVLAYQVPMLGPFGLLHSNISKPGISISSDERSKTVDDNLMLAGKRDHHGGRKGPMLDPLK
jgi:hypothetical protein